METKAVLKRKQKSLQKKREMEVERLEAQKAKEAELEKSKEAEGKSLSIFIQKQLYCSQKLLLFFIPCHWFIFMVHQILIFL